MYSRWLAVVCVQFCLYSILCHDCGAPPGDTPFWLHPCKNEPPPVRRVDEYLGAVATNWDSHISKGLRQIKQQLKIARRSLNSSMHLYAEIPQAMAQDQFRPPTWIPAQGNINSLMTTKITSLNLIVQFIPGIYTDLQKFAVAFEHLQNEDTAPDKKKALNELVLYLRLLLCRVNSALVLLDMAVPVPIERSIMPPEERHLSSETLRSLRAYTILIKYKEYTTQLSFFLKSGREQNRTNRSRHSRSRDSYR